MITLRSLYNPRGHAAVEDVGFLYDLLREREPEAAISHKTMPTVRAHTDFVNRQPYLAWYIVEAEGAPVGAIYITDRREVGIQIQQASRRKGYARQAILALRGLHPGKLLANVAPGNDRSHALFRSMGGRVIQMTYELQPQPRGESDGKSTPP